MKKINIIIILILMAGVPLSYKAPFKIKNHSSFKHPSKNLTVFGEIKENVNFKFGLENFQNENNSELNGLKTPSLLYFSNTDIECRDINLSNKSCFQYYKKNVSNQIPEPSSLLLFTFVLSYAIIFIYYNKKGELK